MANSDDVLDWLDGLIGRLDARERMQWAITIKADMERLRALAAEVRELRRDRDGFVSDVSEFHSRFGVPVLACPSLSTPDRRDLRRALILEEAIETSDALQRGDLAAIADGLADTIYVCISAALELGIPIGRVWKEVHRTNMLKVGGATREDGKILKPDGWEPPDIGSILDAAMGGEK